MPPRGINGDISDYTFRDLLKLLKLACLTVLIGSSLLRWVREDHSLVVLDRLSFKLGLWHVDFGTYIGGGKCPLGSVVELTTIVGYSYRIFHK